MKRLLSIFVLLVFNFTLKAQQPITQKLGSDSTLIALGTNYNGIIKGGVVIGSYTDTTAANLTNIDFYTGSMVWSTSDTSLYVRNKTSTSGYWFKIGGAGGGSGGAYWALTGNAMAAIPSGFGIGTNSTDALPFKTDATTRMILPSNGLVRSSGAANKSLKLDTTTKLLYYGDDVNIYNSNGTITGTRTVDANSVNLTFNNMRQLQFNGIHTHDFNALNFGNFFFIADDNNSSTVNQYMRTANTVPYAVTFNNSSTYESGIVLSQNSTTITDSAQQISIYSSSFIPNFLYSTFPGTTGMRVRPNELLLRLRGLSTDNLKIVNLNSTTSSSWYPLAYNPTDSTVKYNSNGYFSTPISSLTAATGTNDINNAALQQIWRWNSLASGAGLTIASNSTAAAGNSQRLLDVSLSGANATAGQETKALSVSNTHTGTTPTNIGVYSSTSGDVNYGVYSTSSGSGTSRGVYGVSTGTVLPIGVEGYASNSSNTLGRGVWGHSDASNGSGVYGSMNGTGYGVFAENNGSSGTGYALYASKTGAATTGVAAYFTSTGATNNFAIDIGGGALGLSGSAGTAGQVLTSAGANAIPTWTTVSGTSTWNGITDPTGDQALTFDAGESSTWTNSNTTEDLFTINTSTLTTANQLSLVSTSTALAAGNEMLNIGVSGANGTNAITATGARISVTNTNATSGTNVGLSVTASGATTENIAIAATGKVGIGITSSLTATLDLVGEASTTALSLKPTTEYQSLIDMKTSNGTVRSQFSLDGNTTLVISTAAGFRFQNAGNDYLQISSNTASATDPAVKALSVVTGKEVMELAAPTGQTADILQATVNGGVVARVLPTGGSVWTGRVLKAQGADVASVAGAISLGTDGNTFEITGTNAITLISNVNWQNGSVIHLIFTSTATLTDGTANSGTDIGMELAGGANFTGSADDVVTLILSEMGGTQRWREVSRSVN